MNLRLGFGTKGKSQIYRLQKLLYSLKQASRQWFSNFSSSLIKHVFTHSKSEYSLFTKLQGNSFITLSVYVVDILIANNDVQSVFAFKVLLHNEFQLKNLSPLKFFLRLEVA